MTLQSINYFYGIKICQWSVINRLLGFPFSFLFPDLPSCSCPPDVLRLCSLSLPDCPTQYTPVVTSSYKFHAHLLTCFLFLHQPHSMRTIYSLLNWSSDVAQQSSFCLDSLFLYLEDVSICLTLLVWFQILVCSSLFSCFELLSFSFDHGLCLRIP